MLPASNEPKDDMIQKLKAQLFAPVTAAFALAASVVAADSGVPKDYPLKKCPISGEELGSGTMKPFKVSNEGTDVWLCCKGCKKDFDKDPAKYAGEVKAAAKK